MNKIIKKSCFCIVFVVTLVCAVCSFTRYKSSSVSTILMPNVEAMSNTESGASILTCRCSWRNDDCAVNNNGDTCATGYNVKCWEYDENCR